MRRSVICFGAAAALAVSAAVVWRSESVEAAEPEVYSVVEGTATGSGNVAVVVIGKKVSKFREFDLQDDQGASLGAPALTFKSKSLLVLTLPAAATDGGDFGLVLATGKRNSPPQTHVFSVAGDRLIAGAVIEETLDPALKADLDDATTVGGVAAGGFVAVTGTQTIGGMKTFDETVTASTSTGNGLVGIASASSGATYGVSGQSASATGAGVFGANTAATGVAFGVAGQSDSTQGRGVSGTSTATTGSGWGVVGRANSADGIGVIGINDSLTGQARGVQGNTSSPSGYGVYGIALSSTGRATGVHGVTGSDAGVGVSGQASRSSGTGRGVSGVALSPDGVGVHGENAASTGNAYGVHGTTNSEDPLSAGVFGESLSTSGSVFLSNGVRGRTLGSSGAGVRGEATATSGAAVGVWGESSASSGYGMFAIAHSTTGTTFGLRAQNSSTNGTGVFGDAQATTGVAVGVKGQTVSTSGIGVYGNSQATGSGGRGVLGQAQGSSSIGVQGIATNANGNGVGVSARAQGQGNALEAQFEGAAATASSTTSRNIAVFRGTPTGGGSIANRARIDRDGRGYFNGGTATSGADFAESVDVEGAAESYEPGDVMVVSLLGDRRFALSSERESTLVAGVYSTKPALLGSAHPDAAGTDGYTDGEIPLGVVGIVPTKVCDEGGPIRRGDLLVTSSTPGHAMRAPENARPGTIVGKALGELDAGTGVIEILLSLQ